MLREGEVMLTELTEEVYKTTIADAQNRSGAS